jgi:hypothetical protein
VTLEDAGALRGLATDDYPMTAVKISRIADLIEALVPAYLRHVVRTEEDRRAILVDAGTRLWMLAALATPRSLPLAARLAMRATRPDSMVWPRARGQGHQRLLMPRSGR